MVFLAPMLHTQRLVLRAREMSDAPAVLSYFIDPEVRRYLGGYPPKDMRSIRSHLKRMRTSPTSWTVTCNDEIIGECDLFQIVDGKLAHLGYILARPYWGKGLMREACRAVLTYGIESYAFTRVRAQVDAKNKRSIDLLLRLGFVNDGFLPESDFGGRVADVMHFSLLPGRLSKNPRAIEDVRQKILLP